MQSALCYLEDDDRGPERVCGIETVECHQGRRCNVKLTPPPPSNVLATSLSVLIRSVLNLISINELETEVFIFRGLYLVASIAAIFWCLVDIVWSHENAKPE